MWMVSSTCGPHTLGNFFFLSSSFPSPPASPLAHALMSPPQASTHRHQPTNSRGSWWKGWELAASAPESFLNLEPRPCLELAPTSSWLSKSRVMSGKTWMGSSRKQECFPLCSSHLPLSAWGALTSLFFLWVLQKMPGFPKHKRESTGGGGGQNMT